MLGIAPNAYEGQGYGQMLPEYVPVNYCEAERASTEQVPIGVLHQTLRIVNNYKIVLPLPFRLESAEGLRVRVSRGT